jgi:hypothetical protein
MPTRQEAEQNHPVPEKGAAGVESPIAGEMQGANGLPRDTNSDDTEPQAGDQDIDTAGTEADELSVSRNAMGFSRSEGARPAKVP